MTCNWEEKSYYHNMTMSNFIIYTLWQINNPNMNYCKFENTLNALRQCYDDMKAESETEKQARDELLRVIYEINEEFWIDEDREEHDFTNTDWENFDDDD